MIFKKNKKSLKQRELTQKYLKDSVKNETTKINVDALHSTNGELDFLYERLSKLDNKSLVYKLENEKVTPSEKRVILKILDERK